MDSFLSGTPFASMIHLNYVEQTDEYGISSSSKYVSITAK